MSKIPTIQTQELTNPHGCEAAIHLMSNMIPADIRPATGNVTTQEITIFRKIDHLIPSPERIEPTATTLPT
ncbi:hypothetical protein GCK72_017180 [Caenorhabditis remanei]|uniref:Uncharacterized protein n=1 Tax=Caenorhabditis remanei TaxID=31234 RepID=A0A6A5G812_CAERE|nr:hypothetical protein GCK72_017180 [Caenorhabditis remanei]KAF1750629.1 hypothetical protein GCK72_017180 [Caenorhabditis remanei]